MKPHRIGFTLHCPNCDSDNTSFCISTSHGYWAWECKDCGLYEADIDEWLNYNEGRRADVQAAYQEAVDEVGF